MKTGPSLLRASWRAAFAGAAAVALLPAAATAADGPTGTAATHSAGDTPIRVSENWPLRPMGSPIFGRDAVGLAVNPRDRSHVVAVYADWTRLTCETAVSFNGGRAWRHRQVLQAPAGFVSPPCTVGAHLAGQLGGTIAFGRGDTVYTTFATARVNPEGVEEGKSVLVARSTNGGRTFGTADVVAPGGSDADAGPDHSMPKLTVVPGRRDRGERVYVVASSSEENPSSPGANDHAIFTASRNGGRTWTAPRAIDQEGSNLEVTAPVVGEDGRLYVAWRRRGPGERPDRFTPEGTVVVARSDDGGQTWEEKAVAGVRGYVYEGPRVAPFATVQSYTASTFPALTADRRSGDVYLVYGNGGTPTVPGRARAADHFIHPDSDVWFQRSTDGGASWSSPKRINDEPPVPTMITQTRHPSVSVARNGRVDIVWHDRRHWYRGCLHTHTPCLEARLGDTYYAFSNDGGRSFSQDRRITDRHINNDIGYDYRFGAYWDYGPVAVSRGRRRVLIGWMDSRDGNLDTDNQGIYLAEVRHGKARRVGRRAVRASKPSRLAVRLSRAAYPTGPEAVLGGTFATRPWTRVVIVNRRDRASVLAAGVLARAGLATVLLSPAGGLPGYVREEVARMLPIGAYVIGDEEALSPNVVADLAATGIPADQITRIAGEGLADTARLIAETMDLRGDAADDEGRPAFDAAMLVNPDARDAYTASVLAATRRLPILFTDRDELPRATRRALADLDITKVLVVGEEDVISDDVVSGLPRPHRLGGSTPLRTSRSLLAEAHRRAVALNTVFTAQRAIDAALLGPAAARIGGAHLLTGRRRGLAVVGDLDMRRRVDHMVNVTSRERG